jgi:hypothetical protein
VPANKPTSPIERPIRVVFLVFYFEAWDSLSQVYETMLKDPAFDPIVVTIPRKLTGDSGYGGEHRVHKFFKRRAIDHLRLNHEDSWQSLQELKDLRPDFVFLNYPWQRNYQPAFRPDSLVTFTKILYTPYFLAPLVNEHEGELEHDSDRVASHLYTQRVHQLASLIFVQDQATKDAFNLTERGSDRVLFTGAAKLDSLRQNFLEVSAKLSAKASARLARKPDAKQKYDLKVLWAPHHSYSAAWLNFGMFVNSYRQMLELAKKYPNIKFVLRPHPFLFGTLVDRSVLKNDVLENWLRQWKALPNTRLNSKANFVKQFAETDLLLTDGISFLAEYPLITGKTAVFLENANHWRFNKLGELAAESNYRIKDVADFESFIKLALKEKANVVLAAGAKSAELKRRNNLNNLRQEIDPNPGAVADCILEAIANHFASSPSLVDASALSEVAWEDQPGREPRTD